MRQVLLGTTALAGVALALVASPAFADSAVTQQVNDLRQEINQLQQKLQGLQTQVDDSQSEARKAQAQASAAQATASQAVAVKAAPPAANSPITAAIGGQFLFGYGAMVSDQNKPGQFAYKRRFDGFQEDFLARFSGQTTFDNGITAGVFVRLRAENTRGQGTTTVVAKTSSSTGAITGYTVTSQDAYTNDTIKDAYIRLKSDSFGEFRFGDDADVRKNKGYWAPQVCNCSDGFFTTDEPQVTFNNGPIGTNVTTANYDGRATKAAWYSPTTAGFQLALSYAPDKQKGHRLFGDLNEAPTNGTGGQTVNIDDNAQQNFYAAALSWDGRFDDFSIGLDTGFTGASHATNGTTNPAAGINDNNPFIWNAGGQVTYGPWKFGGSFEQEHGINFEGVYGASAFVFNKTSLSYVPGTVKTNDIVTRVFDIGTTYSVGPVTFGAAWSRGIYEGVPDPTDIKRAADNDVIFAGANYLLGPGVNLLGGLQLNNYDPNGPYVPLTKAGLNATYGGSNSSLNIWGKGYTGLAIIAGTAIRF